LHITGNRSLISSSKVSTFKISLCILIFNLHFVLIFRYCVQTHLKKELAKQCSARI